MARWCEKRRPGSYTWVALSSAPPYDPSLRAPEHVRIGVWSAAGGGGEGGNGFTRTCRIGSDLHTCPFAGGDGGAGGEAGTPVAAEGGCPCPLDPYTVPGGGGTSLGPGAGGTGSASGDCAPGGPDGIWGGSSHLCTRGAHGWWGGGAGGAAPPPCLHCALAGSGGGGSGPVAHGPGYRFAKADGTGREPGRAGDPDRTIRRPGLAPNHVGRGADPAAVELPGYGRAVVYWFQGTDPEDEETCSASYPPSDFWALDPCRVADTRVLLGTGPIGNGQRRRVQMRGQCGIPEDAEAVAVQVTAIPRIGSGHLSMFPGCRPASPLAATSVVNFLEGAVRINNAIVPVDPEDGHVVVDAVVTGDGWLDFTVDVTGYFAP